MLFTGYHQQSDWSNDWSSVTMVDMKTAQKTIAASEFKAKCLKILERLDPPGLIITKRGRPIAKVTPIQLEDNLKLVGSMKGKIKIKGDLFSTGIKWNAQS
jgi:prevent-host-death family protein